ncbi:MAG TPA: Wzz/FepE/Etk N-terminal domain-containing protein [Thermoleophilia bacterium]|nr:Wzz/FepE/Etk N-terminal domain-containing protein [Thermoleophilia bacterium]
MTAADDTTIDVGSWFTTLLRNWWVILALVVLGAVVGGVVTMLTPKEYSATSSVYIGQTTDALGQAMAGLNSNPKAATQLLASQALLDEAAKATGMNMTSSRLRRETTVETPSQTIKTTVSAVNIVVITVTDTKKVRATAAANALANALVAKLSPSVEAKVTLLEQQLAEGTTAEAAATARSNASQAAITAIAKGGGTAAEKAAAAAPYVAVSQAAASELATLQVADQATALRLEVAKTVEMPQILHVAKVPDSPSGPSRTLNVAAGALAGLVVGVIVAIVRRRVRGA